MGRGWPDWPDWSDNPVYSSLFYDRIDQIIWSFFFASALFFIKKKLKKKFIYVPLRHFFFSGTSTNVPFNFFSLGTAGFWLGPVWTTWISDGKLYSFIFFVLGTSLTFLFLLFFRARLPGPGFRRKVSWESGLFVFGT